MAGESELKRFCPHCGGTDVVRLGACVICGRQVCDRCGNSQFTSAGRRVFHDDCLKQDDEGGGFSMIKIVK